METNYQDRAASIVTQNALASAVNVIADLLKQVDDLKDQLPKPQDVVPTAADSEKSN